MSVKTIEYPPIAYICMAFQPMLTYRTIIELDKQDYPGRKVLYLMRQNIKGAWPPMIDHDLDMEIHFHNVAGKWPVVWFDKLALALRVIQEPIALIFDEDDMYEAEYTKKAIAPIMKGTADATGNKRMKFVQLPNAFVPPLVRGQIKNGVYDSMFGTIAGKVGALKNALRKTHAQYPNKHKRGRPIDGPFRRHLKKQLGARYVDHTGMRYYFFHAKANTFLVSAQRKKAGGKHRLGK